METTFQENLNIQGHLTIHKIEKGEETLLFDEKNIIVSGFGWSLAYLYSKLGSTNITDYQIDRFQLGVSGHLANQVSSTFQLSGPLSSVTEYVGTGDSNLFAFSAAQYKNSVVTTSPTPIFCNIPFNKVTRIDERSVRYTMLIDEDSCNNILRQGQSAALNEIGLFIKNPRAQSPQASVLCAYKYFSNIIKSDSFALIFRWTISFG